MVSAMHKQTAFAVIATVSAILGVAFWEVGMGDADSAAAARANAVLPAPRADQRADWSNYFEAALILSVLLALYIRLWASYYAPDKISRALSLGCILLFAAIVVVLVKTAKCGAAYNPYTACFDTMTGLSFGFALLDLMVFIIWKCLFHVVLGGDGGGAADLVKVTSDDVEANQIQVEPIEEIKVEEEKTEAAKEKEEEAKEDEVKREEEKEEEKGDEKEEEKEEGKEEEKVKEKEEEKEGEKEDEKEEEKEESSEALPLLEKNKDEDKKD